ncbi:N-acetylmuramoyl-L-alanine amidase family protein [Leyella lascolaii]|uniref:N-acetylmuramoyl-L-alanine amidase n=1 Tax=Leyella lascolaii TaxID=1776379 RepID=A0AAW7JTF9_9BACT|nr:N-acetylmuramoyl-L-alanine amidase [Leyella lascolaii]MDN0023085.1 N-acetylmuramoyl-L-alanine amidase [Leyella lascolaii]MDN0025160.1 N-acetylmuramoyl-L-alanine amidase [Leyella lascolaii]
MINRLFVILALFAACFISVRGADRKFVLVIDAGHGGRDAGALGKYSKEKNINLNVALAFGKYVERNNPDVKVVYTRKTDVFVPLYERAEIANRNKADLFISIHTNALERGRIARGFETYTLGDGRSNATKTNLEVAKRENSVILLEENYEQHYVGYDPNSPESNIMFEFVQDRNLTKSIEFAKMLQKNVCRAASRPDKGVHQSNLAVLRLTSMPACLVELGFITTADEEALLNDRNRLDQMAVGIYNAFVEYKNKNYNGISVPYRTDSPMLPETPAQEPANTAETQDDASARQQPEQRTVAETTPQQQEQQTVAPQPEPQPAASADGRPVFKIQILVSSLNLKDGDAHLKGLTGCERYEENGMQKYTYGASENYNEIYRLRKQILDKFPEAFIIAFKDGRKTDVNQAIKEFKRNRK